MYSMQPNIVIHKLLIQTRKLRRNRIATFDFETHPFPSIEDHASRPQTDLELHDLAF